MTTERARPNVLYVVDNTPHLAAALEEHGRMICRHFPVSEQDDVASVISRLSEAVGLGDSLYVAGHLRFAGYSSASRLGGVELLKHIRLSARTPLALLPIVFSGFCSPRKLVEESPDNLLLFSPQCEFVQLPFALDSLVGIVSQLAPFRDQDELRRSVAPYVIITDADERKREHVYRNITGAGQFLRDFAGFAADDPLVSGEATYEDSELWLKKLQFRAPDSQQRNGLSPDDIAGLQRVCAHASFLCIDDDHRRGWSLGLYSGLIATPSDLAMFAGDDHILHSSDGRFTCIDDSMNAEAYLRKAADRVDNCIQAWCSAESAVERWQKALASATMRRNRATQQVDDLTKQSRSAEESLASIESRHDSLRSDLDLASSSFPDQTLLALDELDKAESDAEFNARVSEIECLARTFQETVQNLAEAKLRLESARQRLRAIERQLRDAVAENEEAARDHGNAMQELTRAKQHLVAVEADAKAAFPLRLVFLDLRLDQRLDEAKPISEASGLKVLSAIRQMQLPPVPVIMMTASTKAASLASAQFAGANGFWTKGASTARALSELVTEQVQRSDLISIWLNIRKATLKQTISCWRLDGDRLVLDPLSSGDANRSRIEELLWESLELMDRFGQPHDQGFPFDNVIIKLGMVQELRIGGLWNQPGKPDRPDGFVRRVLGTGETAIRERRNSLAHASRQRYSVGLGKSTPATWEEAVRHFKHTLDSLLGLCGPMA